MMKLSARAYPDSIIASETGLFRAFLEVAEGETLLCERDLLL